MNVICTTAKNENKYINNWCKYHLNIGFDHIYIFDNNDLTTPYIGDIIDNSIKDKITIFDKRNLHIQSLQIRCYLEFYDKYKDTFDWCAFIDVDEFISGISNVKNWLSSPLYKNFEMIRLKWRLYGDDNVITRDESIPVQDFFKKVVTDSDISNNGKCIVRGHIKDAIIGSCHYAFRGTKNYIEGVGGDRKNRRLLKACLPSGCPSNSFIKIVENYKNEKVFLNHYMTKTLKEFIDQKLNRTDMIFKDKQISLQYFWRVNKVTPEKLKYIEERLHLDKEQATKDDKEKPQENMSSLDSWLWILK